MQHNKLFNCCGLIALLIGLLMSAPAFCQWQQIQIPGGAVVEDLCKVTVGSSDVVWAASMGSGLFRTVWDPNASPGPKYGDWDENIPGKGFLGVDAIYTGGTEYVMGAGTGFGLWYNSSTSGSFTGWHRPNIDDYPTAWNLTRLHDVAFWCNEDGTYNSPPQGKYIVLLAADIPNTSFLAGMYKWTGNPTYSFTRIDGSTVSRGVTRIWRDMNTPNVQYVTADDGIYKLSGPYNNIKFEKLPDGTKLENLNIDPLYKSIIKTNAANKKQK